MKKKAYNKDSLRKRVYGFLDLHPDDNKNFIVNHFRMENIPKSTNYNILKRKGNNIGPEREVGSGRKAIKMPAKEIKRLKKSIDQKDGVSQHGLAKRFHVSQPFICKIILQKTSIRYLKKTKTPKRTPAQKAAVRSKCCSLVSIFQKKIVIIDDESYFYLSNTSIFGNAGFYSSDINPASNDARLKRKDKFEPKLLVLIAFSTKGISQQCMAPLGQAVN